MMTHVLRKAVLGAAMMVAMAFAAPTAQAQAESGMKVATVDVQQLISESKAGKSVQKQLVAEREAIQAEATSIEQTLQAEQKKLMEERAKLSPEDFSKKQVDFEKNLLEARSKLQNRGRALDKSANDTFNELRKQITDIVYTMATDQKIDLVLTRQNVVAAAKSIDITAEVMKALDKKVPDLKVKAEGKAPSKG
ncbi:MAG: OmpH family outer membrane protein [Alphaproteobacteria bacterium]|nr:OmpH family outer membrane protein [Alphaproteobacteria bacterium]MBU0859270.1 OmpH family outer membrane protein [Alphaproteobacteria bacterium]